jgi:hypothetical protein
MNTKQRSIGAKRVELGLREPAFQEQYGIEFKSCMPLRQDETISSRIVGAVNLQHAAVQRCEDFDDRKSRPDVAHVSSP